MLVTTVFGGATQTKTLSYGDEVWDAEALLKNFKVLRVVDSDSSIASHGLAFKVGLCSAVQSYLGEPYSSLFNNLFVTSCDVEGRRCTYLVCSSSLLPALSAINGIPLEIKVGTQTLKSSASKIFLEDEQTDCLSLAPEAPKTEQWEKAQIAFQKLFDVLPEALYLEATCLFVSAFTLMSKIEGNPERLKAAERAVGLARRTGDRDLRYKALLAASEVPAYPNLSEVRSEIAQIKKPKVEQVRAAATTTQRVVQQVRLGRDDSTPSLNAPGPFRLDRDRPPSNYTPDGCFSNFGSPVTAQPADSGLVTPCIFLLPRGGSRNALDTALSVPQARVIPSQSSPVSVSIG